MEIHTVWFNHHAKFRVKSIFNHEKKDKKNCISKHYSIHRRVPAQPSKTKEQVLTAKSQVLACIPYNSSIVSAHQLYKTKDCHYKMQALHWTNIKLPLLDQQMLIGSMHTSLEVVPQEQFQNFAEKSSRIHLLQEFLFPVQFFLWQHQPNLDLFSLMQTDTFFQDGNFMYYILTGQWLANMKLAGQCQIKKVTIIESTECATCTNENSTFIAIKTDIKDIWTTKLHSWFKFS